MGRKNRRVVTHTDTAHSFDTRSIPFKLKRILDDKVDELLKLCTTFNPDWTEYEKIYERVQEIREIEKGYGLNTLNRENKFPEFLKWLAENGVENLKVEIALFEKTGFGVIAKQHIKENELWLTLPRKLMLSTESAQTSVLRNLIQNDRLLQSMPNISLALCLLNERCNEYSFWAPYIATLPDSFDTPTYFGIDELRHLTGSPTLDLAIRQYISIARQYAYIYKLLHKRSKHDSLSLSNHFTYDSYRWSVSAVMTRQNRIPSPDGSTQLLALVPMWDMCNHANGKLSTDYNLQTDQLESYAFRSFDVDEQVFIFYGSRPNSELLVHNGFVYANNPFDSVAVHLELRKSDPLYKRKADLAVKLDLPNCGYFTLDECPIDGTLLAFHRISAMNEDVLQSCLQEDRWCHLTELEFCVDLKVERTCWKLLQARIQHLLSTSSPTQMEEATAELSSRAQTAILLKQSERNILQAALCFATTKEKAFSNQ